MAECRSLERKDQKQPRSDLLVKQVPSNLQQTNRLNDQVAKSYAPFLSTRSVSLVGQPDDTPITILQDTGATQTLLLENMLLFSEKSFTGDSCWLETFPACPRNFPYLWK